ncbi:MAG: hypothetical protein ACYC57_10755 [Thermoleophilia bacterium]
MKKEYPEIFMSILSDAKASGQDRLSLVDIIWRYDGRNKLAPLLSELNTALQMIDWVNVKKQGKELFIHFTGSPQNHVEISSEDFDWADNEYRRRFWKAVKDSESKTV